MRIKNLILIVLALIVILSLGTFPVVADEPTDNVIFICDGAEGDGSSAESPLKPTTGNYDPTAPNADKDMDAALYQAWQKLMKLGGGTIVICGPYTLDDSNCAPIGGASADFRMPAIDHRPGITITYTSVWNGVDYRKTNGAELILEDKAHLTFPTSTVIENLTIRGTAENGEHFIAAGLNSLTLGKGTNFIPFEEGNLEAYPMILGSFRSNAGALKDGNSKIIIDIGDENYIGNIFGMCNGGNGKHNGNTNITIKSGNIGNVYGDSRATSQVPQVGNINITLEGGIYHGVIAGVNVGFVGNCSKTVNLTITGGNFDKCQGILAYTDNADANLPEVFQIDCSAVSVEVAKQIKSLASEGAALKLPTGYSDETKPTNPTEPPVNPTEPSVNPTEPSVNPTEPSVNPTEPAGDPAEPTGNPTEPAGTTNAPANTTQAPDNSWILIAAAVVVAAAVAVIVITLKKK